MTWSPQLYSLWTVLWLWKQRAPTGNLGFNCSVIEGGMDDPKKKKTEKKKKDLVEELGPEPAQPALALPSTLWALDLCFILCSWESGRL